jgi:aspartokinase
MFTEDLVNLAAKVLPSARQYLDGMRRITVDRTRMERNLADVLHALALLGSPGEDALAWVSGLGEVLSSRLVQAAWRRRDPDVLRLDAREVLVVRHEALGAVVGRVRLLRPGDH